MKQDITTREDVRLMVETFYERLLQHEDMQPVFAGIDLEHHLPRIVDFWCFVLLNEEGYKTNVFEKHVPLALREHLFGIWVNTFRQTVNDLFAGVNADIALQRAEILAFTFRSKLKQMGKI